MDAPIKMIIIVQNILLFAIMNLATSFVSVVNVVGFVKMFALNIG